MEVFETRLPGVGVRYEFTTSDDDRVGVLVRRDGRRELVVYDREDPDTARDNVALTSTESATLVELLGGSKVTEHLSELHHEVEGLSIEWVTMPATGGLTGHSVGEGSIRTATGASVVAVIRDDVSIPGPGPELRFAAGDVVLVMGAFDAVHAAATLLTS